MMERSMASLFFCFFFSGSVAAESKTFSLDAPCVTEKGRCGEYTSGIAIWKRSPTSLRLYSEPSRGSRVVDNFKVKPYFTLSSGNSIRSVAAKLKPLASYVERNQSKEHQKLHILDRYESEGIEYCAVVLVVEGREKLSFGHDCEVDRKKWKRLSSRSKKKAARQSKKAKEVKEEWWLQLLGEKGRKGWLYVDPENFQIEQILLDIESCEGFH